MKFDGDKRFYVTQRQLWALEKMIGEVERAPRELALDTRHRDDDCVREGYVCHDGILLWLKQEVDNDES